MRNKTSSHRNGSVMVYSIILMTIMLAMISLGVDYGRVQIVKSEMQRAADNTALQLIRTYVKYGGGVTGESTGLLAQSMFAGLNPIDANSGVAATTTVAYGYWNTTTQTFTPSTGLQTPIAAMVTIKRTAATNNPVSLTFPLIGNNAKSPIRMSTDVIATAIAVDFGGQTASPTVGGIMDPWLAGMADGATASDQDTAPAESPALVMNVVPGTYITVTNVSGSVDHDPSLGKDPPTGDGGPAEHHMFDDSNGTAVQNGIGDVIAPLDALMGVFLKSNSPDQNAAPTVVRDYTTQAARDLTSYNDIQAQQPFYIGTGKTSGGTVQTFRVPPGCTRLYMGPMDGHQWANNGGSFSATVTQSQDIQLVQ